MRIKEHLLHESSNKVIIKSYHSVLAPQKREYREHHHTECELSVLLAGSGTYLVNGRAYPFQKGDVFLFGSNEPHCITEITEDMELLNLQFEPRLLWERSESVELLNLFAARSKHFSNRITDKDGFLAAGIQALEREITQKEVCATVMAKYHLFSLLAYIIRTYDYVDPSRVITAHSSAIGSLKKVIGYIHEHLDSKLTLKALADMACMTPTYFSAVFKKFNGVSPWEYITIKRVEKAIDMLRTTSMTKLEIAGACGFTSSSNFYKAFFSITGKTPSDFVPK